VALYVLMAAGLSAYVLRRWPATGSPPEDMPASEPATWRVTATRVRLLGLALAAGLLVATFVLTGGNRFTRLNVTTWVLGSLALAWGLGADVFAWPRRLIYGIRHGVTVRLSPFRLLVLMVLLVGVFWRFYRLSDVPPEMTSDHAEKLYDVMDVLAGQWRVFFPRNAGREPIQMYLTAFFARVVGTGIHFLSLKLATAVGALALLPTMYALGCTWQDRETGLWAMALVGVAYWLQVITRAALRFVFYPLFAALTLLYLLRGLQRGRATDFLWAGVFLGAGLYGYTSFRLMPVVIFATFLWYAWHQRRTPKRELLAALVLMGLMALALATPMFRYMIDEPQWFFYRSMTRLSTLERPYPDAPWRVFVHNVFRAAVMFWWDNGEVWLASVPKRPALDLVAAALMTLGMVLVGLRYVRTRRWQDGWWFLLIPLLQLPSSLALAFPNENPNLYRAGAALIPAFLFAAAGLRAIRRAWDTWRRPIGSLAAVSLWLWSMAASYHLVFVEYQHLYRLSTWNASEMGEVIGGFARSVGEPDQAWVVPYPFWVDTRLVGIWAGYPGRDYALFPDQLDTTLAVPAPKMFLLKPEDQATLERLWALYPQGRVWRYRSPVEGKDFLMYFVPIDMAP
ncbi:MAG: hypothetical protein GXO54_07325, partial [Chloroflexi bacterium]|nr:hypothetical protein [Chloroflexota bacterium]